MIFKNLKCQFVIILFLLLIGCGRPYISGSIQVHSIHNDKPEIQLQNPIGEVEIGVERNNTSIFLRHFSSIPQSERGYGYNSIGVEHKLYLW